MRAKSSFICFSSLSLAIVGCGGTGGSPDVVPYSGPTLVFHSESVQGMMAMRPDGSDRQTVHANTFVGSMTENGIVFTSITVGGHDVIYSMKADGANAHKLTNTVSDFRPCVTPDGSKVAFISFRDGNYEIYVMNGNGSSETRLTNDSHEDYYPAISADGTKIVFTSNRAGAGEEIYSINVDGTSLTRLTNNAVVDMTPAWSPDGTKIVFSSQRDGNAELYIMDANGGNVTRLTTTPSEDELYPSFKLDGSAIFYNRNNQVWRMNPDGTGATNISNNANNETKTGTWVY